MTATHERARGIQHRHSITCRWASAVKHSTKTKTQVGPASVLDHSASVAYRHSAATVHLRTATAHISRRLLLVLVVTAKTPAEDFASVKKHRRGRHGRHLAKTFDVLGEQVEGHLRVRRRTHGWSQDRHGSLTDISMGISNRPVQCLRPAIPRQGKGRRPDATRHSLLVNKTARPVTNQGHRRLKRRGRSPNVLERCTLMSHGRGGYSCLAPRRWRTPSAGRSSPTRRPTGRPRPWADICAIALSHRHGRVAFVVRASATGGMRRKASTRVVQHEPVLGRRVQIYVLLRRRTRLRVASDDFLDVKREVSGWMRCFTRDRSGARGQQPLTFPHKSRRP